MRNLLRNPLTWLVVAEFVVVGALIVMAWNVVGDAGRSALAAPPLTLPESSGDPAPPPPDIAEPNRSTARGPLPGLNLDSAFWRDRLRRLNSDQVVFEQLEWRIVRSAMDALHRYLETVVMPSITAAEEARAGGVVP